MLFQEVRTLEDFQNWRATVVAQVRFKPDRRAIEKELTDHYQDHVRDLERLEYPTELARQRALAAMGDSEAIGKALDRVHKPWLGWLWKFSRWLMAAACLLLVVSVVLCGLPDLETWARPVTNLDPYQEQPALSCPQDVTMGPYTLRTDAVWYTEGMTPRKGKDTLILDMTSTTRRFWLQGPIFNNDYLEAVDSNGVQYQYRRAPYVTASSSSDGHIRHAFWIQVDGIENDPAWIEITYRLTGWTLHVDLPGREEAP